MLLRLLLEGVGLGGAFGAHLRARHPEGRGRDGAPVPRGRAVAHHRAGTDHEGTNPENSLRFKRLCIPGYLAYVLVCVYALNGARGFLPGFWQLLVILSIMNVIDRLLIDDYWVGHTDAWIIPGTGRSPALHYRAGRAQKMVLRGRSGMAVISAVLAGIMALILH